MAEVPTNKNKNSKSYSQTLKSKEELNETNIKYCKTFDLKITEQDKTLPIMYWLPKMYNTPIGARFIVHSKRVICFHISLFYTCLRKFWFVENSFPFVTQLNKINTNKKAKSISTVDFTTVHTTPHDLLIQILSEVISFIFRSKT